MHGGEYRKTQPRTDVCLIHEYGPLKKRRQTVFSLPRLTQTCQSFTGIISSCPFSSVFMMNQMWTNEQKKLTYQVPPPYVPPHESSTAIHQSDCKLAAFRVKSTFINIVVRGGMGVRRGWSVTVVLGNFFQYLIF